jgi:Arc/MetJ family transcription regulator
MHNRMQRFMENEANPMRTTLNIDDQLFEEAVRLTGVKEKTALLRESLKALIQRESARRLALLGGSEPDLDEIPRRRNST